MTARWMRGALVFFGIAAAMGAAFVLAGPVVQMRVLGAAALALALLGMLVELYALRTYAPGEYAALRDQALRRTHRAPAAPVALGRRSVLGLRA